MLSTNKETSNLLNYYAISQLGSVYTYRHNILDTRAFDFKIDGSLSKFVKESKTFEKYDKQFNKKTFQVASIFEMTKYMHIFIDIIKDQLCFNKNLPIIKTIRIKGNQEDIIYEEFKKPQYCDINKTFINKIEIKITDENFIPINFTSGSVDIKIHIRKKKK